jgi:hypothetical protein
MPRQGVPTSLVNHVEDDIAAQLTVRDALIGLALFVNHQKRRGYVDSDDLARLRRYLADAQRANERRLDYARWTRGNLDTIVGTEGGK